MSFNESQKKIAEIQEQINALVRRARVIAENEEDSWISFSLDLDGIYGTGIDWSGSDWIASSNSC